MKNRFPIYFNLIVIVCIDIILLGTSWYAAFLLRYNFDLPMDSAVMAVRLLPVVILIKIIAFYFFNVYRGMWRYTSLIDLFNIIKASVLSTLVTASKSPPAELNTDVLRSLVTEVAAIALPLTSV